MMEITVNTRIKTAVLIKHIRPFIFIYDKKQNLITLIEIGVTSGDNLTIIENEKLRKYDILANDIGMI